MVNFTFNTSQKELTHEVCRIIVKHKLTHEVCRIIVKHKLTHEVCRIIVCCHRVSSKREKLSNLPWWTIIHTLK